jgi:hypothetical protein
MSSNSHGPGPSSPQGGGAFLHFRSWLRTGPPAERILTATAAASVIALLAWASAPHPAMSPWSDTLAGSPAEGGGPGSAPGSAPTAIASLAPGAVGQAPGQVLPGQPGQPNVPGKPGTPLQQGGGTPVAGGRAPTPGASSAARACGPLTSTDKGVTASTITVGVVVIDLGAANNVISVPPVQDQEKAYRTAFADINSKGGSRCRKIVPQFYRDNPLDSSSEHSLCLQMQQDKVFAVLNNLYTSTEQTCVAKSGIPNVWYTPPHTGDVRKYYPYILSWQPDFDKLIHQYVRGAKAQGFFTGMKKLGILEGSCFPDEKTALVRELKAAGIDPGKASSFNYGCTGAPAPQADQSAVLQFQREGVTHVLNVAFTYDGTFAAAGDQQRYKPKYAHMDDASASSMENASTHPGNSFDGALLITTGGTGSPNTPGYAFNKATKDCVAMLARAGLPNATQGTGLLSAACVNATLLAAAADHAPTLTRAQLANGLARAGTLELSYPAGPVQVTDARVPTAGSLARPGAWATSCQCWKVLDPRFRAY